MELFQGSQKQKLLILQSIFNEKTDEEHSLTVNELISELEKYGIKSERKTIYDDISTLIECKMDIVTIRRGHSNAYYLGSRVFQEEELQVLADAIASSKFLTTKKSNELIKKLQSLTSSFRGKNLRRNIYVENRVKTFNESIYYNINAIHCAIFNKYKITFKYLEYNLLKEKKFKHNGELYTVSPYYLIWEKDYYYLVCFSEKHQSICRFRVDRISDVNQTALKITELSKEQESIAKNLRSTYDMYGGELETVTLELDKSLINVIIDRYGDNVTLRDKSDTTFIVRIEVQISPPFWGWLFQFGTKAKILAPQNVVNQAIENLTSLNELYKK